MKKIKVKIVSDENIDLIKKAIYNHKIIFDDNANTFFIEEETSKQTINVKLINGNALIKCDLIYSIESFDHEINIYCDEIYITRTPLKEILPLLSNDFIQINQSVIINITKIKKVISSLNQTYTVYLDNNKKYTVTRSYFKLFNERIGI